MTLKFSSTRYTRFVPYSFQTEAHSDALGSLTFELSICTAQALDIPDLSPRLRRKCLSALSRICGRQALLPKALQIPIYYTRSNNPLYHGGFADVWKGNHQGRHVAVKVLRVCSTSDTGKIASVGLRTPAKIVR
jgi:hypothetical protein